MQLEFDLRYLIADVRGDEENFGEADEKGAEAKAQSLSVLASLPVISDISYIISSHIIRLQINDQTRATFF